MSQLAFLGTPAAEQGSAFEPPGKLVGGVDQLENQDRRRDEREVGNDIDQLAPRAGDVGQLDRVVLPSPIEEVAAPAPDGSTRKTIFSGSLTSRPSLILRSTPCLHLRQALRRKAQDSCVLANQLGANAPQQADHRHLRSIALQQMQAEEQRKRVITGIGDCKPLSRQSSLEEGEAAEFRLRLRGIDTLLSVDIQHALQLHIEIMARLPVRSYCPASSLRDGPFDLAPSKHGTPMQISASLKENDVILQ